MTTNSSRHSLSLSPFKRYSNTQVDNSLDDNSKKKRNSLKIITGNNSKHELSETITNTSSKVRQRISSLLFRSTPKENKKEPIITIIKSNDQTDYLHESPTTLILDNHSTNSFSSSSDFSDHMPSSPGDISLWEIQSNIDIQPSPSTSITPLYSSNPSSLAFQVFQALGSTIDEVDEEIDIDWENSRSKLRQSLVLYPKSTEIIKF